MLTINYGVAEEEKVAVWRYSCKKQTNAANESTHHSHNSV